MDTKLFIPVILGTNRKGRHSDKPANLIIKKLREREKEVETRLVDVKDFSFPQEDYGTNLKEQYPEYLSLVKRADAFILVAPEYNHSIPGSLKSLLDIALSEYRRKAVGLVGVSAGGWGGTRVIEAMAVTVRELGLVPTDLDLHFPHVRNSFDEQGNHLKPDIVLPRIEKFFDTLIWMAKSLRWGRENL